jgi:hypothetical protein
MYCLTQFILDFIVFEIGYWNALEHVGGRTNMVWQSRMEELWHTGIFRKPTSHTTTIIISYITIP